MWLNSNQQVSVFVWCSHNVCKCRLITGLGSIKRRRMPLEEFLLLFLTCLCVAMQHTSARCLTCQSLKCASLGEPSAFYHSMSWQKETYRVKIPKQQLTTNTFPWKHWMFAWTVQLTEQSVVQSFSGCESHSHVLWRNTTIKLSSFVSETSDFSLLVSLHPENIPDDLFVCFTGISNHCRISLHLHLLKNRFLLLVPLSNGKQVQETLIWIWCFLTSSSLTVWRNDTNTMDLLTQIQPQSQDGTNKLKRGSVKGKLVCFQLQRLSWSCEYTTNLHLLSSLPTETLRKANRWIWSS